MPWGALAQSSSVYGPISTSQTTESSDPLYDIESTYPIRLEVDGIPDGLLEIHQTTGSYYLPLEALFNAIPLSFIQPVETQIQVQMGQQIFLFRPQQSQLWVDGIPEHENASALFHANGKSWVNATWLALHFPVSIHINEFTNTLSITLDAANTPAQNEQTEGEAPPPTDAISQAIAAPVGAVTQGQTSAITGPPPPPDMPVTATREGCPAIVADAPDWDYQEVLEIGVGGFLYDELVDGYRVGNAYYLAVPQLADALDFAVEWNEETQQATGWFLDTDQTVLFDLANCRFELEGDPEPVAEATLIHTDDTLYLRSDMWEQWFPIELTVDGSVGRADITPLELLPFQQRQEREQERERWKLRQVERAAYPVIEPDYTIGNPPFVYFAANSTFSEANGNNDLSRNLNILAAGDVAPFTTRFAATADGEGIQSLRVNASRRDRNSQLFGINGLSQIAIGDVEAPSTELLNGSGLGRGLFISSEPDRQNRQFDTIDLVGDAPINWEVELYNNNVLIDFLTVGADNRYAFENVAIEAGSNTLLLVFFGPNGEIREEERVINIGDNFLPEGEFSQAFSIQEQGINTLSSLEDVESDSDGFQAVWRGEYGLTSRVTALGEFASLKLDDGIARNFVSGGVRTSFGALLVQATGAFDTTEEGTAFELQASTPLFGQSFQAGHLELNDFNSGSINSSINATRIDQVTNARLAGQIPFFYSTGLGYLFSAEREKSEDGDVRWSAANRLSTNLYGLNFSHTLTGSIDDNENGTSEEDLQGSLSTRGRLFDTLWRANANYTVKPEASFDSVDLSLQRYFTRSLNARLDFRKSNVGEKPFSAGLNLTWDTGKLLLNSAIDASDQGDLTISLGLSGSLYWEPYNRDWHLTSAQSAEQGVVSALAFLDENYNLQRDPEEEILTDVAFQRGNKKIVAGENGITTLTGINPEAGADISLREEELEDAYWILPQPGFKVYSRPGAAVNLEFPVHDTSELEGTVWIIPSVEQNEDGSFSQPPAIEGSGLALYLLNANGDQIKQIITEYDGYYIMDKLVPGEYILSMDAEELKGYGISSIPLIPFIVENGGDILSQDVELKVDDNNTEPDYSSYINYE